MFRFQHHEYLPALVALPVLVLLFILLIIWRNRRLRGLGEQRLVTEQLVGFIPGRRTLKFILLSFSLALAVTGLANLQRGAGASKAQRKGVDVILGLDVSKSMLARDLQPDRLTRAKQFIERLLDKMHNNRVGLIVFAGRAYLQVPLTVDYAAMRMMLQNARPELVPTQGTVISDAIELSIKSFSQKEQKYKSLIIISDGEDHDAHAQEKIQKAVDAGIVIHTIGIGSPQGITIYDPESKAIKLDEHGNPVVSRLNEEELKSIAKSGHGTYTLLTNTPEAAEHIATEVNGMEQKYFGTVYYTDYNSYFQYFLLPALLLLAIEWLIPGAKNKFKTQTA